jgi:hypothetical protein
VRVPEPSFLEASAVQIGMRHIGSAWVLNHYRASSDPEPVTELPLALMIEGALRYFQNNPDLTRDYVLYPKFCEMLEGMRGLLCGSVGRFDQGVLDELLYNMTEESTREHPQIHADDEEQSDDEPHGARDPIDPRDLS